MKWNAEEEEESYEVYPLIMWEYLRTTMSSQPHLRFLPVVTPISRPIFWRASPTS